jgi:hypothetical protein
MKTWIACLAMTLGITVASDLASAQRYRDYDDGEPRYRGDRGYRGGDRGYRGGCLSSDEINARLRSQGYRQLALRDQGPNALVMSTIFRGRPYLIFVNGCTGNVFDTRSQ